MKFSHAVGALIAQTPRGLSESAIPAWLPLAPTGSSFIKHVFIYYPLLGLPRGFYYLSIKNDWFGKKV
jgi:hypothetical protein